ncbi:uncharacterized protein LOC124359013 [Homalodisca vitripennis]|uniref:uncharacterized protein LOC124359013 n=1 Tax=Homalodisca vitripennis TaxID=197043 RepID=UPI001EEB3175|nr:uncharacterized protein LOC124359013 [Homalodisca vitripennis]
MFISMNGEKKNMGFRIFLLTALSSTFLHLGHASKCDQEIIEKIIEYWNGYPPGHIIETAIANVKEVVVGTTHGYYPDCPTCVYSFFMPDRVLIAHVYGDGETAVDVVPQIEEHGATYDPTTCTLRYHVYTKCNVTGFYTCTTYGEEGDARGAIKVRADGYDPTYVEEAKEVLKCIGVEITDEYPDHCC